MKLDEVLQLDESQQLEEGTVEGILTTEEDSFTPAMSVDDALRLLDIE